MECSDVKSKFWQKDGKKQLPVMDNILINLKPPLWHNKYLNFDKKRRKLICTPNILYVSDFFYFTYLVEIDSKQMSNNIPGANLRPNHTDMGMIPWWITCSVDTCSFFLRSTKNSVSKNSVNLLKQYHQQVFAIYTFKININPFLYIYILSPSLYISTQLTAGLTLERT